MGKLRHKDAIDIPHPECDKALAVKGKCQIIGQFLEWAEESRMEMGRWINGEFVPANIKIDDLLAKYFKIDQMKLEKEKRALLDELVRRNNSQN